MHPKLKDDVQFIKGVGPKRREVFAKLGLRTVWDALNHFPRGYEDRSQVRKVADLAVGDRATIRVRVGGAQTQRTRGGRELARVLFEDETGGIEGVWFNTRYWDASLFEDDRELLVTGKVDYYNGLQIVAPHCEPTDGGAALVFGSNLLPDYPLTEGLSQISMRKFMKQVVEGYCDLVEEYLPDELRERHELVNINDAYRNVHFPEDAKLAESARFRLVYSEFLVLELGMALRRHGVRREDMGIRFEVTDKIDARIRRLFPFELTAAQERAIKEIRADMRSPRPMNRILQGDVGSGKTVVAMYALLAAIADGCQAAIMAPTEVLAEQHYRTFGRFLARGRVRLELMVGSRAAKERRESIARLASGEVDIAIGTHALVQPDVAFRNLGMVVVDEQHKFGVLQRHKLRQKGKHPDVLVMTATPIPRTLSLTVFGDLDFSVIDEMPPNRRPVKTFWAAPDRREKAYQFICGRLQQGEQAFIIYPLVEESDKIDLQAAVAAAEALRRGPFRDFTVGLLHGRMSAEEKNRAMHAFRDGDTDVLVSTIVIEVGIDVPNASVMIVEHAERFGLAQLHQLRGRIGRGTHTNQAWFIVFGNPTTEDGKARLKIITETADGFRIAEEDLRLRGPGEFLGTRQHGLPDLGIGDIIGDFSVLRTARRDAFKLVADDPDLAQWPMLRQRVMDLYSDRLELIRVG